MLEQEIEIINKLGLHARAAAKLVKLASSFDCTVDIEKEGQRINAKSIMGVMMLAASCGNYIRAYIDGPEEHEALDAIVALFEDKFGEDE